MFIKFDTTTNLFLHFHRLISPVSFDSLPVNHLPLFQPSSTFFPHFYFFPPLPLFPLNSTVPPLVHCLNSFPLFHLISTVPPRFHWFSSLSVFQLFPLFRLSSTVSPHFHCFISIPLIYFTLDRIFNSISTVCIHASVLSCFTQLSQSTATTTRIFSYLNKFGIRAR